MSYDPRAAGATCDVCPLRGKKFVPPEGPGEAEAIIIGEGPGKQEELKRRPFIGPSGMLLNELLGAVGLKRAQVFITNTMLCRVDVPGLKGPKRYNVDTYLAWLRQENGRRRKHAQSRREPFVPIPSPVECCHPRLMRELQWHESRALARGQPNGAVVIPVGNYALRATTGKIGVKKWRGSPLAVRLGAGGDITLLDASGKNPNGAYDDGSQGALR